MERSNYDAIETIIPRGIIEVIFNFSCSDITVSLNEKKYLLQKCFINGFNTKPIKILLPQKQFFFGVRFHPVAVQHIFGVPPYEFANITIDLTLIDATVHTLWDMLAEEAVFWKRVSIVETWLKDHYTAMSSQEKMFNSFLHAIPGSLPSVTQLSRSLCYSPRHLSRKFLAITGMNAEQLLLYKKFQLAVHLMHRSKESLTQLAYSCQFADQSHLVKTFKSFAGITPGEYKKMKGFIEGHLYQNVR